MCSTGCRPRSRSLLEPRTAVSEALSASSINKTINLLHDATPIEGDLIECCYTKRGLATTGAPNSA